jgi:hypothetical protein
MRGRAERLAGQRELTAILKLVKNRSRAEEFLCPGPRRYQNRLPVQELLIRLGAVDVQDVKGNVCPHQHQRQNEEGPPTS